MLKIPKPIKVNDSHPRTCPRKPWSQVRRLWVGTLEVLRSLHHTQRSSWADLRTQGLSCPQLQKWDLNAFPTSLQQHIYSFKVMLSVTLQRAFLSIVSPNLSEWDSVTQKLQSTTVISPRRILAFYHSDTAISTRPHLSGRVIKLLEICTFVPERAHNCLIHMEISSLTPPPSCHSQQRQAPALLGESPSQQRSTGCHHPFSPPFNEHQQSGRHLIPYFSHIVSLGLDNGPLKVALLSQLLQIRTLAQRD